MRATVFRAAAFAAVALCAAPALRADRLVMRDGSTVETEGPWRTEGEQVVFRLPGGSLAALPAAEVDFEATERLAAPPAPVAAESSAEPGSRSRWVITDADVRRGTPEPAASESEAAVEQDDGEVTAPAVTVESWNEMEGPDGELVLVGTVANAGPGYATGVEIQVSVLDDAGELLALDDATLSAPALPPGGRTSFRASFPDVVSFSDVRFEIDFLGFASSPEPLPDPEGDDGAEGAAGPETIEGVVDTASVDEA